MDLTDGTTSTKDISKKASDGKVTADFRIKQQDPNAKIEPLFPSSNPNDKLYDSKIGLAF